MTMSIPKLEFPPFHLPAEAEALRVEVRAFLKETLPRVKTEDRFASWNTRSAEFSKAMGRKGWIGITWPKQYGGSERTFLDRYVITEELLGNSAPAGAHWVADRQSGPLLLRFGSEEQRQAILHKITAGECYFSIGMSEPDSGSDLASVRTRAEPVPGGFRVNGTKVWTSGAHHNHYCIALVRTSGQHADRHKGLSPILVALKTPGITIRPIINLAGRHDWNEVTFNDAFIPESCLIGNEGDGWLQVTSELAFEAALVKDLGTIYQQDLPEIARTIAESDATTEEDLADFLDVAQYATMMAPSYTIQGGSTQVLRGIVARGLGLR